MTTNLFPAPRMTKRPLWFACVFLLLFPLSLFSQPIQIQEPVITAPVQTLSVNDVDFVNSTTPKWIFTITLITGISEPVKVTMTIDLTVRLANGENLGSVVRLETDTFVVTGTRSITNLDLKNPQLRKQYVVNDAARKRLEEIALPSGLVPAGFYNFDVQARSITDEATSRFDLILSNPSTVELLSPVHGDAFVNEFPLFQWRGDAPRWRIAVYEMLPDQRSLEEAVSGIPHLSTEVSASSLQYPSTARPLLPGRTYAWYVEGLVTGAGGVTQSQRSEIRSFSVATMTMESVSSLLDELERVLGPRYQSVIAAIRSEGLSPSGVMRLNGSPISTSELLGILSQLRSNADAVTSVTVE